MSVAMPEGRGNFEYRLGDAFELDAIEKGSKLEELYLECKARLEEPLSPEDRQFYQESLKLLSSSLILFTDSVQKNIKNERDLPKVYNHIYAMVNAGILVLEDIEKIFKDPQLSKDLDPPPPNERGDPPFPHLTGQKAAAFEKAGEKVKNDIADPSLFKESTSLKMKLGKVFESFINLFQSQNRQNWETHERHKLNLLSGENVDVPGSTFKEGRIRGDRDCGFSATNTTRQKVLGYLDSNDEHIRELVAPEISAWLVNPSLEDVQSKSKLSTIYLDPDQFQHLALSIPPDDYTVKGIVETYFHNEQIIDELTRTLIDDIEHATGIRPQMEAILNDNFELDPEKVQQLAMLRHDTNELLQIVSKDKYVFESYRDNYYADQGNYLIVPEKIAGYHDSTGVLNVISEKEGNPIRVWMQDRSDPTKVVLHYVAGELTDKNKDKALDVILKDRSLHFNKLIPNPEIPDRIVEIGTTEKYSPLT